MSTRKRNLCSVCAWPGLTEPPRSASGGASYEICPSCGFQFGVTDDDEGIPEVKWRARWIEAGMPWSSTARPAPARWNAARQLSRLNRSSS